MQFGDGFSNAGQVFDYSMEFGSLHNIAVGAADASVHPLTPDSDLRITGNLTNEGTFNSCQTRTGSASISADFLFQGNTNDQIISGGGTTSFWELSMDRQGGGGVVESQMDIFICNLLDLREATNPNDQILALGTSANATVLNSATTSVEDGTSTGVHRYVRTSVESGRLIRTLTSSGVYTYPIGSFDNGGDQYTPATFTAGAAGADGTVGVRVSPGQGASGAHLRLSGSATDFTNRYWSIDDVTTTIAGQWQFDYLEGAGQITGNEADFGSIGRYRPIEEAAGGNWLTINGTITQASNLFQTQMALAAADFEGDWLVANFEAFRRLFYSRQTGDWTDPNSWTFDRSHIGPIAGAGLWPDDAQDSVVIGGGSFGLNDHVISLDQDVAVQGVALGTGDVNTGTLNTQYFTVSGQVFNMSTMSTIQIGSDRGIELAPTSAGNITTTYRIFSTEGNYTYNGTTNQVTGTGLPQTVASLTVSNTGINRNNNIVSMLFDVTVNNNLTITRGTLDMVTYTANSGTGAGQFALQDGAWLKIGGTNNMDNATAGYAGYFIGAASTVEFYGGAQTIAIAPNAGLGYGNVIVRNPGIKQVLVPVIIRGDCSIFDNAELYNAAGVDALHVHGNVNLDASTLNNEGHVIIGN